MDTLYYDGSCPLCAKEIRTLRKLQRGRLAFADIHEQEEGGDRPSREMLLRRLHLWSDEDGWVVGLRANVRAWSHTRFGPLLRPLLWPGIYALAGWIYATWADRRYQLKYACGACQPK